MLQEIPYKCLERRVYDKDDHLKFDDIKIRFSEALKGKVILEMGILEAEQENKYVVQVIMPWGNIYELRRHEKEEQARQAFEFYDVTLNEGCNISIMDASNAIIFVRKK